ncbi:MAG: hypothetical protein IJG62_07230 [Synergistaceae bacterium]|nr:hypothetical protein [Synergistaceae bacterium]MBQ6740792.1 hypothetical protein [Synergistaceae bacterium]
MTPQDERLLHVCGYSKVELRPDYKDGWAWYCIACGRRIDTIEPYVTPYITQN